MWGRRPSASANMEIYRPDGALARGASRSRTASAVARRGAAPHDPDRLGDINPVPVAQGGVEFRHMTIVPVDGDATRDVVSFPMQLDAYVAVHPLSNLTAYLDVGYHGSTTRSSSPPEGAQADDFIDIFWLREVWAMLHDLPGSSYVRAGRMPLPYGWRIPDHTAFIRDERFDQDRHAYGVEVGLSPNIFWGNLMAWYQGIDSWPGEITQPRAGGVTAQGGCEGSLRLARPCTRRSRTGFRDHVRPHVGGEPAPVVYIESWTTSASIRQRHAEPISSSPCTRCSGWRPRGSRPRRATSGSIPISAAGTTTSTASSRASSGTRSGSCSST